MNGEGFRFYSRAITSDLNFFISARISGTVVPPKPVSMQSTPSAASVLMSFARSAGVPENS